MKLTILGSTGSIGVSTLDVIRQNSDKFQVHGLVAGRNVERLCSQILEFRPPIAVVANEASLVALNGHLAESGLPRNKWPQLMSGDKARVLAATTPEVNFVMSAIVGVSGIEATYAAIRAKKRIGLANKEVLVASGRLVMEALRETGAELIPVDSEHNGAHQCFRAGSRQAVTRLLLTASGGPFRNTPVEALWNVTPEEALNHPTWKMGRRITIDSATLMNKGFEVIEACWLFDLAPSSVEVIVHPQSSIHAMLEYNDGSVIAQISATDMRMPIQYALTYPERHRAPVPRLDWTQPRTWNFSAPDLEKFRLLKLAYQAQERGGSATCTLNAADEIAVEAFLDGRIPFPAIALVVEETLSRQPVREPKTIPDVISIDQESREVARRVVAESPWASYQGAHAAKS
ncbi:MAG: 1-deoxy-D-xylulose-5-phosphate reductoisomerase [Acidobacteriaceae bacterium]|nr:1-deoxy-D-xylulose-5-phosphate reductoisomerase [Acidobacteriaceae bacterium]MBV9501586.1 1-deoxy-D-xylulose-5-phosphate reductoisomerase [Acidobacteriaceae bacterium]